ncbi:hypothetical protein SAMN02745724_04817 [Pseudoalteromonas denitrificans DSM 6059]|uniref:Uncharacterized protein n=1 Tax=Pseudoalteromonas denitrificans DSM 6059 TaxID=1123010 RepID=A0A1I1T8C2_9GAMM|nr:hypothetical protein SAMN02745724_04817 [Pseudoalteromonas denitrificans DSM 6059]
MNWFGNLLLCFIESPKTIWLIIFGMVFFILINEVGYYMLANFELTGSMKGLQDSIFQKLARRYDKIALISLIGFWALAFKQYFKDCSR